jgi:hypothetical protein
MEAAYNRFPVPSNDFINRYKDGKEWFCAFKSVEQFQKWVKPKEINELFKLGFKVLMIDVQEYQEGKMQIAYTKESVLQSKDISELFKEHANQ